jgi:putative nucleotidyltransferase with HDIG domain
MKRQEMEIKKRKAILAGKSNIDYLRGMQLSIYLKKGFSIIRDGHQSLYKTFLFVVSISFIVYIFPKQTKFKYEFQNLKGKPWNNENLIAPFDFAIRKTKAELRTEKAEIINTTKPYFIVNNDVVNAKEKAFEEEFEKKWSGEKNKRVKDKTFLLGKQLLDSIYDKGILQTSEVIENKPNDYSIYVLQNNVAEEHDLKDFYTIASSYEFLKKKLSNNINNVDADFLLPLLENSITHSVVYDKVTTDKVLKQALENVSPSRDIILSNQSIISKGEIVDAKKFQILESLKAEYEDQSGGSTSYASILIGQIIIIALCIFVLMMFLYVFRKEIYANNTKVLFVLSLVMLEALMVRIAVNSQAVNIYILPFCILPIIIRSFYDTRVALFVHIGATLITSFMVSNPFEFVFIQLLGGIVTIFSIVNMHKRSQIFLTASYVFITYSAAYTGITILQEGGSDSIAPLDFAWFAISALLTLFSYPLIFVFEKIFGFISDVSILELSDTNGKLLRQLASVAPGTFQHSLQVANLAEEAIFMIGGNALLVRTGALFHDIGKMENPLFFVENQTGGINPHQDLSFEDSAAIIIEHVINGIEIAKKNNLPEQIIDFIRTHHGTTYTGFFYRSFKNEFPEEKIDEEKFRYPGPVPFSKETAVLMMADSVEAASRSLKKYDAETIDNLVENIINKQIEYNQFINSDITFKNINTIKKIFKKKLMNIYHIRVEYPR